MIISALMVRFNFKFMKHLSKIQRYNIVIHFKCHQTTSSTFYQFDAMTRSGSKMPDAFFSRWIRMRIIGAEDLTKRSSNLVFATTFFAVMSVFMKGETIVASANVRADCVPTFLLTSAIIHSAFVLILFFKSKKQCNQYF